MAVSPSPPSPPRTAPTPTSPPTTTPTTTPTTPTTAPAAFTLADSGSWDADPHSPNSPLPPFSPTLSPLPGTWGLSSLGGSLDSNPMASWKGEDGEYPVLAGVMVVVTVVSLVGNVMVIVVTAPKIWVGGAMPPNVLVLFLAVSDVLRVFFEILPELVEYVCMEWRLGSVLCKVVSSLRCVFSSFSMSTMALISFERYRAVDKPSGTAFTAHTLSSLLFLLSLWTVLSAIPPAFWFDTVALALGEWSGVVCTVPFYRIRKTALYTSITRVTNFLLPLVVSWLCYMGIVHKTLKSRARVADGLSGVQKSRRQRVSQKVTMTCFCLVTLFTLTLTPFQLTLLVMVFGSAASREGALRHLKYLWLLTLLQSTANPFLYGLMWENFRQSVKRILQRCMCRSNSVAPLILRQPRKKTLSSSTTPNPSSQSTKTAQTDSTALNPTTPCTVVPCVSTNVAQQPERILSVAFGPCHTGALRSAGVPVCQRDVHRLPTL